MMKFKVLLSTLPLVFVLQSPAFSAEVATSAQLQAIAEMGRLNGIALQCRYLPQVQRIKRELVLNLPKQRALGDWFEQKTNDAFMGFMQQNKSCPAVFDFDQTLQHAFEKLEAEFKK
jgi:hypothetical protein